MARRQSYWDNTLITQVIIAGAGTTGIDLSGTPGALSEGFTLVRTIFDLKMYDEGITGLAGMMRVDLGIGNVNKDAFAANVLPDPNDATERPIGDWIYRTRCLVPTGPVGDQQDPVVCHGDIRAGRKLGDGTLFMGVVATQDAGSSFNVKLTGIVRCLILRP